MAEAVGKCKKCGEDLIEDEGTIKTSKLLVHRRTLLMICTKKPRVSKIKKRGR